MHRLFRALFGRKMAFSIIALITLIALFYAVENFRGAGQWENYRKEAEARGLKLDFAAHIPPPIPDEENGANTPWITSWFPKSVPYDKDKFWPPLRTDADMRIKSRKPDGRRHLTDFVAYKQAFELVATDPDKKSKEKISTHERDAAERTAAAAAVLEALKIYEPTLNELRAASAKTRVRYPVEYKTDEPFSILLPHLAKIKSVIQLLSLRANAELALGKSEEALKDVQLMLWFTESMRDEPFLINHLVRIACLQITAHTIWEGLAQHQWNDGQLRTLETQLATIDFLGSIQRAMNAERAGGVATIEWVRKNGRFSFLMDSEGGASSAGGPDLLIRVLPRGWIRMEEVNYCRVLDENLAGVVDLDRRVVDPQRLAANNAQLKEVFRMGPHQLFRHRMFASMLLPAMQDMSRKFAVAQNMADEAAVACALERYRLANGKLPESLDALAPKFITKVPHDVLSGAPLKYERVSDTEFVLSSVGWPESEKAGQKSKRIEWIWRSAP
jgi:hypothetical protein